MSTMSHFDKVHFIECGNHVKEDRYTLTKGFLFDSNKMMCKRVVVIDSKEDENEATRCRHSMIHSMTTIEAREMTPERN
jgi:hypothetical protein